VDKASNEVSGETQTKKKTATIQKRKPISVSPAAIPPKITERTSKTITYKSPGQSISQILRMKIGLEANRKKLNV
jgi:hypothetical protein